MQVTKHKKKGQKWYHIGGNKTSVPCKLLVDTQILGGGISGTNIVLQQIRRKKGVHSLGMHMPGLLLPNCNSQWSRLSFYCQNTGQASNQQEQPVQNKQHHNHSASRQAITARHTWPKGIEMKIGNPQSHLCFNPIQGSWPMRLPCVWSAIGLGMNMHRPRPWRTGSQAIERRHEKGKGGNRWQRVAKCRSR